ncbi:MAG: hypothetical protein JWR89_4508 [Tardiphaga sp.]|jgi:hypothetical protein|uniref:hypothetical protein n=1 Tax=Tardiphaga sp. TaxID=1926292 RepID=UPI00261889AB|nr:hypothetical protein [Tardiphaga sp.]MDB5504606.1 hypothetical protein [Tardiphaga sp.]
MSASSVSAAPAVTNVKPIEAQPAPVKASDRDKDDSRVAPPPPRAALPPGQGTRIDQFA